MTDNERQFASFPNNLSTSLQNFDGYSHLIYEKPSFETAL